MTRFADFRALIRLTSILTIAGAWAVGGLFIARLLAEAPSVRLPFYAWLPTLTLTIPLTISLTWLWQRRALPITPLLPLYLLVSYLFRTHANPLQAGVLAVGVVIMSLGLVVRRPWPDRLVVPLLFIVPLAAYLSTLTPSVGERDGYELQAISATLGYAHPTGYPLFPILGRLWIALFPFGSLAWRINVLCALYAAASVPLLYGTARRILGHQAIAAWSALAWAFSHTLWNQAAQPEKYTFNLFFVSLVLYIALGSVDPETQGPHPHLRLLALVYGLSLTHHRTMLMLAPALALYLLWRDPTLLKRPRTWLPALGIGLAPLLIYLYIPWRACAQSRCMSVGEFFHYISGSYYGAAVRLTAWASPERVEMFWRFLLMQFGPVGVGLGLLGLVALVRWRQWRTLACTALAYVTYYIWGTVWHAYYNDVNSFLPNHLILSLWMGAGLLAIWEIVRQFRLSFAPAPLAALATLLPISLICNNAPQVDRSAEWTWHRWGEYAIAQDLAQGATVLADRVKYPPLDYFARIERRRPDLDVVILDNEKAYLDRLAWDLAHNKTVYLARFLPGLEGPYHLRSSGPLVEVGQTPLSAPETAQPEAQFSTPDGQPVLSLLRHTLEQPDQPSPGDTLYLTLYWHAHAPVGGPYQVHLRLVDPTGEEVWRAIHHPVSDMYPTTAWKPDELIPDWYEIPLDPAIPPLEYRLEVGLFQPFSESGLLAQGQPWVTLEQIIVGPAQSEPAIVHPLRAVSGQWQIVGYNLPSQALPTARIPLTLYWQIFAPLPDLEIGLRVRDEHGKGKWTWQILGGAAYPTSQWPLRRTVTTAHTLTMPAERGKVWIEIAVRERSSGTWSQLTPGWLRSPQDRLILPPLTIVGRPPAALGSYNFNDRIVLTYAKLQQNELVPGSSLDLTVEWQCAQDMNEDYTLFVQLIAPDGTLKGQLDVWPRNGTHPTSAWQTGESFSETYTVFLNADAPPGTYRVIVGWYLLETMQRLPVLNVEGTPVADHVLVGTVQVIK